MVRIERDEKQGWVNFNHPLVGHNRDISILNAIENEGYFQHNKYLIYVENGGGCGVIVLSLDTGNKSIFSFDGVYIDGYYAQELVAEFVNWYHNPSLLNPETTNSNHAITEWVSLQNFTYGNIITLFELIKDVGILSGDSSTPHIPIYLIDDTNNKCNFEFVEVRDIDNKIINIEIRKIED